MPASFPSYLTLPSSKQTMNQIVYEYGRCVAAFSDGCMVVRMAPAAEGQYSQHRSAIRDAERLICTRVLSPLQRLLVLHFQAGVLDEGSFILDCVLCCPDSVVLLV